MTNPRALSAVDVTVTRDGVTVLVTELRGSEAALMIVSLVPLMVNDTIKVSVGKGDEAWTDEYVVAATWVESAKVNELVTMGARLVKDDVQACIKSYEAVGEEYVRKMRLRP